MKKVNESGRSMVEMLGVLAIIGVLSVGGIAGYSKAMNKFKLNKVNDQMSMLVANLRTLYATQTSYLNLTNSTAKTYGVIPSDMYTGKASSNSNITNPYSGLVTVNSITYNSGANRAFYIAQTGIPSDACISIVTNDWGSDTASGFIGMDIKNDDGHGATKYETTADASGAECVPGAGDGENDCKTPLTITQAMEKCKNSYNTIVWYYY